MPVQPWHTLAPTQVAGELTTDLEDGLATASARERLRRHGPNRLPQPAALSPWQLFLEQFKSVMTLLLLAATAIALVMGDEVEAIAVVVVLILNGLLGFFNEYRAERSVEALEDLVVPVAEVVRDGELQEIAAQELVPGDLVVFEAGDRIAADGRLVEAWSLRLDESALTGESVAVDKDGKAVLEPGAPLAERQTMVYMGTTVVQGRGRAIVTATGPATEMGRISSLLAETGKEQTPLEERLDRLGRYLALAAVAISAVVALVGVWRGEGLLPMLETSLALAIAAVPEGLPAVVTIALALGMRRMAERRAIVRRLSAVETLGSTNVIGTDKTGTLTRNEMTVREVQLGKRMVQVSGVGYEPRGTFSTTTGRMDPLADYHLNLLLRAGLLCNNAALDRVEGRWEIVGDPTEGALVVAAAKAGLDVEEERARHPVVKEIPFDARDKRMATFHRQVEGFEEGVSVSDRAPLTVFVKGAPEVVVPACNRRQEEGTVAPLAETEREELCETNAAMAEQALRVLALAYKSAESEEEDPYAGLIFLGFVGMIDPPRPESRDSVQHCQRAGIRVMMITGDQKGTAQAIARELQILHPAEKAADGYIVEGQALDGLDDAALQRQVAETAVYARVSPEHKLRIVQTLQTQNQVVAMTGDGVNDAPALKAADIGVAMGEMGTDVARKAADMILADDNFATIVAAVEEGRIVFSNIRKFVHYLFSCNLSEILTMFLAVVVGWPLPLLPLQILWLNLVTDVFPAMALAREPAEPGIMDRPPPDTRRQRPPATFALSVLVQGVTLAAATLMVFGWSLCARGDATRASTLAFLTLGLAQLFHVFNSRTESGSVFGPRFFANRAVWGAVALTVLLQALAVHLPALQLLLDTVAPTAGEWMVVLGVALAPALLIEAYQILRIAAPSLRAGSISRP